MMQILVSRAHAQLIEQAARAAAPREYCAALLGTSDEESGSLVVTNLVRLWNCDSRPGRFAVSEAELNDVAIVARERSTSVIALLHSHAASRPTPSEHDLKALTYADWPWIIAGPTDHGFTMAAFAPGSGKPLCLCVASLPEAPPTLVEVQSGAQAIIESAST